MIVRTWDDETVPNAVYIPLSGSATGTIPAKNRISLTPVQGERSISGKQSPVFGYQWRKEEYVGLTH